MEGRDPSRGDATRATRVRPLWTVSPRTLGTCPSQLLVQHGTERCAVVA